MRTNPRNGHKPLLSITILALACLAACGSAPDDSPECTSDAGRVVVRILKGPSEDPVKEDLAVLGTATHEDGLAIRRVLVDGIEAKKDTFNFETWSVSIPLLTLQGQAGTTVDARVEIPVEAEDPCGWLEAASFSVKVDLDAKPAQAGDSNGG